MMLVSRTSTAPDVTHAGHSVASPAPAAAVEAALRGFAGPRWPSAARSIIFEALVKVKLPPVLIGTCFSLPRVCQTLRASHENFHAHNALFAHTHSQLMTLAQGRSGLLAQWRNSDVPPHSGRVASPARPKEKEKGDDETTDHRQPGSHHAAHPPGGAAGPACWAAQADQRIPTTSRTASINKH